MLSFDIAVLDRFSSEFTFEADIIQFGSVDPFYITNADTELYYSGNRYRPVPFEVPSIESISGMTGISPEITFANADDFFTSYFLNVNRQGEEVILSKYYDQLTVAPYMKAEVENFSIKGNIATLALSTEFALWQKKTLRYPSRRCPWPFKLAPECGYSGLETWCDRTPERCLVLNNYPNFGGRKYIRDLQNKQIYWGEEKS